MGEVKIEGQDAKEGGVYKKKMVFIKRGGGVVRHKYQREREKKQEEH